MKKEISIPTKTIYTFPTREIIRKRYSKGIEIILTYGVSLFTFSSLINLITYVLALV